MKKIYLLIITLCATCATTTLLAQTVTTYYVSVTDVQFNLASTNAADIVIIEAGSRGHLEFDNSPGSEGIYSAAEYPITIKNENCTTKVLINNEASEDYLIKFENVENVHLTGTGSSSFGYGIELCKQAACTLSEQHGIVIGPFCSNIKIDHVYIHDIIGDGIRTDWDFDPNDQNTWYSDDPNALPGTDAKMEHINVNHNKLEDIEGNGIILGNKEVEIAHPHQGIDYFCHMMFETYIYHNILNETDSNGIALYGETGKGYIYNNSVRNYGYSIPNFDQDHCPYAAIVVGLKSSNCEVYNNIIRYGKGHGIYDCGKGSNNYYNNVITEAGFYNTNPDYTISAIHIDNNQQMAGTSSYFFNIYNNTIVKPYSYGVNLMANTSFTGGSNRFFYNIIALSNTTTQSYYSANGTNYLLNALGTSTNKLYPNIYGPHFVSPLSNNDLKPTSGAINACSNYYYGLPFLEHDCRHCNHGYNLSFTCPTCNSYFETYRPKCGKNDAGAYESRYCSFIVSNQDPGIIVYIPKSIPVKINGENTAADDYLAICSRRNDSITCGGFIMWGDTVRECGVSPRDSAGNGFLEDEEFFYFYYDASSMEYIELQAKYDTNYSNRGIYIPGDSCRITGLYQVQEIPLRQGWSIFSTCIEPDSADIDNVMSEISDNVNIVENYDTSYVPGQHNGIGDIEVEKAYKVSMSAADTLEVWGTAVKPEETPVPLNGVDPDWCLVAYLRTGIADIEPIFENGIEDIDNVKIIKNQDGIVYWPEFNVNFIDTMIPGQGYEVKMNTIDTLYYPANDTLNVLKSYTPKPIPKHFVTTSRTNNSLALGIENSAWDIEPVWGDEIGVFNTNQQLVGSGMYCGDNMAITVWGAVGTEITPNGLGELEQMSFKLFSQLSGTEEPFEVLLWHEGSGKYTANGISIAGSIKRTATIVENRLMQNMPNPHSGKTTIRFYLDSDYHITNMVYNQEGKQIHYYNLGLREKGNNSFNFSSAELAGGVYHYTLKAGEFEDSRRMIIIK